MDNKLAFKDHIAKTVNNANQITGMIRRSFQFMDIDMFKSLFTSRVRPVLEYGNTIWCPRNKKDVTAIENVQKRATKMVPGLHNLQYEDRLKKLKLPSLIYRRERGDMIETYKYLTNIYNTDNPWLILEADSNTRGHSLKLTQQRYMTELRRHCFSNRIVNSWNSLSDHDVAAETLNALKARLDKLWKNRMYEVDT